MSVLSLLWLLATAYLVFHYLIFNARLAFYREPERNFTGPVSVVICARNEAANLRKNLPVILTQKEVAYEVVVVNDRSTDGTDEILKKLKGQYPNLKTIEHRPAYPATGKKAALLAGLRAAGHPHFVLTDADCRPSSPLWLRGMAAHFQSRELVLGFSPYRKEKGLASYLTQWDTLQTAQQYFSFALAGRPYMGVGRNLAYSRKLFESSDQFASHLHLASGDDDLFVGQIGTKQNTAISLSPHTFTWSGPPKNFKNWWRQKRRHLTTASSYSAFTAFLLANFGGAQLLFYLLLPGAAAFLSPQVFWSVLLLKFLVQMAVTFPLAKRLRQTHVLWFWPVWEFLTVLFLALIHLQNLLQPKKQSW